MPEQTRIVGATGVEPTLWPNGSRRSREATPETSPAWVDSRVQGGTGPTRSRPMPRVGRPCGYDAPAIDAVARAVPHGDPDTASARHTHWNPLAAASFPVLIHDVGADPASVGDLQALSLRPARTSPGSRSPFGDRSMGRVRGRCVIGWGSLIGAAARGAPRPPTKTGVEPVRDLLSQTSGFCDCHDRLSLTVHRPRATCTAASATLRSSPSATASTAAGESEPRPQQRGPSPIQLRLRPGPVCRDSTTRRGSAKERLAGPPREFRLAPPLFPWQLPRSRR